MLDTVPRGRENPPVRDASPGDKLGRVRLSLVDYRLAGVTLVAALTVPWMAAWKDNDRDAATLARGCQPARILGLAFSPDGKTVATSRNDRTVVLRNVTDGATITRLTTCPSDLFVAVFSPDSRFLALGGTQPDILLWDLRPDGAARPLGIPVQRTSSLAFSPDGGTLAVAAVDSKEIILWDVFEGHALATLRDHESPVHTITFSPDGRSLASGATSDPVIIIWDVPAARPRLRLDVPDGPVRTLAFSPDGALLASACGRVPSVRLWDMSTGRQHRQFTENLPASHVAFSANGQFLATYNDETIQLWKVATGEAWNSLDTAPPRINTLAVSSDGLHLAVSADDEDLCLWNLAKIRRPKPEG